MSGNSGDRAEVRFRPSGSVDVQRRRRNRRIPGDRQTMQVDKALVENFTRLPTTWGGPPRGWSGPRTRWWRSHCSLCWRHQYALEINAHGQGQGAGLCNLARFTVRSCSRGSVERHPLSSLV